MQDFETCLAKLVFDVPTFPKGFEGSKKVKGMRSEL